MFQRLLVNSRYLILIAVIGSLLASIITLIFGGIDVIQFAYGAFTHGIFSSTNIKIVTVESIQIIDLFLVGTVFYIIALGLYQLFIDETLPMPTWLVIHTLDDLKSRLLGVVAVLLAVTFLANVVSWDGQISILYLGLAVGIILFALGFLLNHNTLKKPPSPSPDATPPPPQP